MFGLMVTHTINGWTNVVYLNTAEGSQTYFKMGLWVRSKNGTICDTCPGKILNDSHDDNTGFAYYIYIYEKSVSR